MQFGLNFKKKIIQSKIQNKIQHYSVASPQIKPTQKVEQHVLDEDSILRATYYLQGLLIKTEALPYEPEQSPLQHNNYQHTLNESQINELRTPPQDYQQQSRKESERNQVKPPQPQHQQQTRPERNEEKPQQQPRQNSKPEKKERKKEPEEKRPVRVMHTKPRSPEELKVLKQAQDQYREQESDRDKEIFKNTIREETEKQKIIIESYSFVHMKDAELQKSLSKEQRKDYFERFQKYMSEVNKTFVVYRGITLPKEYPVFELFCIHIIDQIEAMSFIDNHLSCDFSGVRQFLLECYTIADDTSLDYVEAKVFDMLIQYKIPINSRFYYRRLNNLKHKGDFIGICNVWDLMNDKNRTSLGLKCVELAVGGIVIDCFKKACSILHYIAHTPMVDIRGYPESIYKIIFQFESCERVTLDTTEQNVKNFESLIQSCASIIRKFETPHNYSFVSDEQVSKIIHICAVSAVNAWAYLSKWDTYVNRKGRIEVYDDMLHMSLYFTDGPLMARKLFDEIVLNRIIPRIETLNSLVLVHIKYGELEMAKNIFKKINFSNEGYKPNETTNYIRKQLESDSTSSTQRE
jgi:hypothetical protein